jgi:acyl-CoA thioesterase
MTLIEQYNLHNDFGKTIGMHFEIIEPGLVHYFLTVKQNHLATPATAHGGVISSLMDGLLGVAALSAVEKENKVVSTIEFKINFLSPAFLHDNLHGIGKVEQKGNRLIIVSGDIFCVNRENSLIAKAIGTFNAYPAEKAGFTI